MAKQNTALFEVSRNKQIVHSRFIKKEKAIDYTSTPAVTLFESHLLATSTTIRHVLAKKRSNSANFDRNDEIARDYKVSKNQGGFFPESKGIYISELFSFAAKAEGSSLGVAASAEVATKLSSKQLFRAMETWIVYIVEDRLNLGNGSIEAAIAVGKALGVEEDYLAQLEEYGHQSGNVTTREGSRSNLAKGKQKARLSHTVFAHLAVTDAEERNCPIGERSLDRRRPSVPETILLDTTPKLPRTPHYPILSHEISDVRGADFQPETTSLDDVLGVKEDQMSSPSREDAGLAEFPFKYASKIPRIRIYVTADRKDLHFDHPRQPLYLDLPESLACENSALIQQALYRKRESTEDFDLQDELIWDPSTSRTARRFSQRFMALDCSGQFSMQEWAYEVKHLMLRHIGEVWDGLKTWIDYIKTKEVALSCPVKARHNMLDVAIFLGAPTRYVGKLRRFVDDGNLVELNPRRGRPKPPKKGDKGPPEELEFEIEDQRASEDVKRKKAERPRSPQKGRLTYQRTFAFVELAGLSNWQNYYNKNFGKEGGPLSVSRSNDSSQVIHDDFRQMMPIQKGNPPTERSLKKRRKSMGAMAISDPERQTSRTKKFENATTSNDVASHGRKKFATRNSAPVSKIAVASDSATARNAQAGWLRRSERRGAAVQSYKVESESDDDVIGDLLVYQHRNNQNSDLAVSTGRSQELTKSAPPVPISRPSTFKRKSDQLDDSSSDAPSKGIKFKRMKFT
ncbi:hypothetical protein BKA64DRAFT_720302 [Cadophora sp. MPI-SDFR-AT-0126]|nr:hypothetical protein BKA64DRAFT_720302 [Leotiomycetes sp. MPI-SDFR-AT-0126]